ncbi:LOW QUALITY PROTEIN: hypothetical protein CVT25_009505 [Psilocybe cyanescens]|uniref:Uncharacterized protein n=1 Tax=Psilocybe cyanescens TaxID=93625 RepID=A0A409XAL6_PSICY|nr:LOW QUALITY PROTEIN: hypothetical protein CVT25_009505 [Psilocybe cyanescens]
MRRLGINWLTYTHVESPELSAVLYKNKTRDVKVIPALLIWREHATTDWLIFDKDELDLLVYVTDFMELESSAVIPHAQQSHSSDADSGSEVYINKPYTDWISYMEYHWESTVNVIRIRGISRRIWIYSRQIPSTACGGHIQPFFKLCASHISLVPASHSP